MLESKGEAVSGSSKAAASGCRGCLSVFRVKVFGLGGGGVRVRWSVLRAWAVLGFVELRAAAAIGTGGH